MGKNSLIPIIAIVVIAAFATGYLKLPNQTQSVSGPGVTIPAPSADYVCQTDGSNELGVSVQDVISTSTPTYIPATVRLFGADNQLVVSGTATGGGTKAYTALAVPCTSTKLAGTVLVAGTANTNSVKSAYNLKQSLADQTTLFTSNSTVLAMCIYSTGGGSTNLSLACNTESSANETNAVAVGAQGSRTVTLQFSGLTGGRQFGSTDGGVLFSIDTVDTAFGDKDISLSSSSIALSEVACPTSAVSYNSANRCYHAPAIRSDAGVITVTFSEYASAGNPTLDPIVYIDDYQTFEQNGAMVTDIYDSTGTTVGVARQMFTINNS